MSESYSLLIAPHELAEHLEHADWVVFDCRHQLSDPHHGARVYPGSWSQWCADPARPVETEPQSAWRSSTTP